MSAELLATRREATLILTLSNPGARNALHPDMYAAGIEALETAERDPDIRAVILTGAGDTFCAGGNLNRLLENRNKDRSVAADSVGKLHAWVEALRDCPKPVIAAVEGPAAGAGFSLVLACDLIVAAHSAQFIAAYVKVGLSPDGGMSWSLSQSLPPQLVTEILMEGKPLPAARLHQHGIINRVVSDGQALNAALDWSDELARQSPHSISSIKSLVREASTATLPAQLKSEQHAFVECLHHRDALEGMTAFLEKRKPNYS